jgi:Fe-S-cluster containining protein
VLTPYDIIRLKKRLHLSSGAFLDRHTTVSTDRLSGLPVVKLKMQTDETRRCPFVSPGGCVIYEDRPGACRLYPLGRACLEDFQNQSKEYYFTVKEAHCPRVAGRKRVDHSSTDDVELTSFACG